MSQTLRVFFVIVLLTIVSAIIALPDQWPIHLPVPGHPVNFTLRRPQLSFTLFGHQINADFPLKEGLDIQGGIQVVLRADMKDISPDRRAAALESAREIIQRRVDLFGVSEPVVQTAQAGGDYRIIVELAGMTDANQALQLIGTTAQLDFRLPSASASASALFATPSAELASGSANLATQSADVFFNQFQPTGLTGKQLQQASVEFDQKTGAPQVAIQFNDEGRKLFADITSKNTGKVLAIFLDNAPLMFPVINTPILDGQGVITGNFTVAEANQLKIQLNAGALPVPIEVLEQHTIGASLGQESVQQSVQAGLIGICFVVLFMVLNYRIKGFLASIALFVYAVVTVASYKLLGVTLTLPGIAGLLLSIGMAVDANILIFERMKEELRSGKPFQQAMELGFQRAWNSIRDANLTTIMIAIILINPLDFWFWNSSGLVKGFGLTLLIGVLISLFTSMIVTKTLMRLFLQGENSTSDKSRKAHPVFVNTPATKVVAQETQAKKSSPRKRKSL